MTSEKTLHKDHFLTVVALYLVVDATRRFRAARVSKRFLAFLAASLARGGFSAKTVESRTDQLEKNDTCTEFACPLAPMLLGSPCIVTTTACCPGGKVLSTMKLICHTPGKKLAPE